MRIFLYKSLIFFGLITLVYIVGLVGLVLPLSKKEKNSYYYAKVQKDSLLINTEFPRIIFVGGSNLSFGLNSNLIKDSLMLNPINTGSTASFGLEYMISESLKGIKEGDIVVLAPEYSHFFGDFMYGGKKLIHSLLISNYSDMFKLSTKQYLNIFKHIPEISFKRIKNSFNRTYKIDENEIYSVNSFNKFGDVNRHWAMKKIEYTEYRKITDNFNQNSIAEIINFNEQIIKIGATLYITFPGFQDASYDNSIVQIKKVEDELNKTNLKILGKAVEYRINDSLTFDTPYHLNKIGVDYRTQLFISDFKKEFFKP